MIIERILTKKVLKKQIRSPLRKVEVEAKIITHKERRVILRLMKIRKIQRSLIFRKAMLF